MKKYQSLFKTSVSLFLIVLIFYLIGKEVVQARGELTSKFTASLGLYAAVYLVLMFVIQLLLVYGWRSVLELHGIYPPLRRVFHTFAVPILGKYLPGKVVFLAGRVELVKKLGVSRVVGLSCFILENLYIGCAACLLSLPAFFLLLGINDPEPLALGFSAALLALILVFKSGLPLKVINWAMMRFRQPASIVTSSRTLGLQPLLVYSVLWLVYGAAGWFLATNAVGDSTLGLVTIGSAFIAAWLAGFAAFVMPGGLGVREGVLVFLLSPVMTAGEAGAIAIVSRLVWTLAELGLGFLIIAFSSLSREKESTG